MEISDIKFKDGLRKELLVYKQMLKLIDTDNIDELRQLIQDNIERINAALQD